MRERHKTIYNFAPGAANYAFLITLYSWQVMLQHFWFFKNSPQKKTKNLQQRFLFLFEMYGNESIE